MYVWSLTGLRLLVALAIALTGAAFAAGARLNAPPAAPTAFLGAFLVFAAISAALSPNPFGSQQALLNLLVHGSGYFLVAVLATGVRQRQLLIGSVFLAAVVMGLYGVAQLLGFGFTPSVAAPAFDRVSSTYFNYAHYAGFLDLVAPLALAGALMAPRRVTRTWAALLALLLYLSAGLTFSYAGWGSLGLATVLLLWWWGVRGPNGTSRSRAAVVASLFLAGLLVVGAFVSFSPRLDGTLSQRLVQLLGERDETGALTGEGLGRFGDRLTIFGITLPIVREHPWFGVGPGNFIYAVTEFRLETAEINRYALASHKFVNYAHNDYLQVASEEGIFALAAFVTFWFAVLAWYRLPSPWLVGAKFGLLAILVHGLMDGNLTVNHGAIFLAFVLAALICHEPIDDAEAISPNEGPAL
jgi:O-antigen ligase